MTEDEVIQYKKLLKEALLKSPAEASRLIREIYERGYSAGTSDHIEGGVS